MPIDNKHLHFYLDYESDPYRSRGEFKEHRPEFNEQADEFNQQAHGFNQHLDFGVDHGDGLAQAEGEFKRRPAVFGVRGAIAVLDLQLIIRAMGTGFALCPSYKSRVVLTVMVLAVEFTRGRSALIFTGCFGISWGR